MISDSKRCAPSTAVVTGQSSVQPRKSRLTRYPSASTRRNAMMMPPSSRSSKPSVHPVQGDRVTRWHGDTSFSTFRLARGQAGTFGLIFPACPRESKSSEFPVTPVTLSPRSQLLPKRKPRTYGAKVRDLWFKSQRLTMQKPETYDEKVRDLRCKSQ